MWFINCRHIDYSLIVRRNKREANTEIKIYLMVSSHIKLFRLFNVLIIRKCSKKDNGYIITRRNDVSKIRNRFT